MLCSTFLTIEYIKGNNRSTLPSCEVNLKTRLQTVRNVQLALMIPKKYDSLTYFINDIRPSWDTWQSKICHTKKLVMREEKIHSRIQPKLFRENLHGHIYSMSFSWMVESVLCTSSPEPGTCQQKVSSLMKYLTKLN